jgi:antitoxin VapB
MQSSVPGNERTARFASPTDSLDAKIYTCIYTTWRFSMTGERKARIFKNGGSQAVRLPADFRFQGDEVYITRDETSGDVTLSSRPRRNVWKEYIAYRDSLNIPREDLNAYMSERPMNQQVSRRSVFEDEA